MQRGNEVMKVSTISCGLTGKKAGRDRKGRLLIVKAVAFTMKFNAPSACSGLTVKTD